MDKQESRQSGFAGSLASAFIDSKLTPLGIIASLLLGIMAIVMLPREEEPQIKVPMIDVMVVMEGATPKEVEEQVTIPMEKLLYELPDVEYIYSTSMTGQSLLVVTFLCRRGPGNGDCAPEPETGHQLRPDSPQCLPSR